MHNFVVSLLSLFCSAKKSWKKFTRHFRLHFFGVWICSAPTEKKARQPRNQNRYWNLNQNKSHFSALAGGFQSRWRWMRVSWLTKNKWKQEIMRIDDDLWSGNEAEVGWWVVKGANNLQFFHLLLFSCWFYFRLRCDERCERNFLLCWFMVSWKVPILFHEFLPRPESLVNFEFSSLCSSCSCVWWKMMK